MTTLISRAHPLAAPSAQRDHLEGLNLPVRFERALTESTLAPLSAVEVNTLQVNVGKLCNQTCRHCHVDAGPDRTEVMSLDVAMACLDALRKYSIPTLDITGGAPEVYPHVRELVNGAQKAGAHVMHRCNLTSLLSGPCRDLPELFARHNDELI